MQIIYIYLSSQHFHVVPAMQARHSKNDQYLDLKCYFLLIIIYRSYVEIYLEIELQSKE
jgi:hypothetical protein